MPPPIELWTKTYLDIDAVLTRLAAVDATSADVARFRIFPGLSIDEAAEALGLARATAFREWAYTRSWLTTALAAERRHDPGSGQGPTGAGAEHLDSRWH
jgi:hypothetical protein